MLMGFGSGFRRMRISGGIPSARFITGLIRFSAMRSVGSTESRICFLFELQWHDRSPLKVCRP